MLIFVGFCVGYSYHYFLTYGKVTIKCINCGRFRTNRFMSKCRNCKTMYDSVV